MEKQYAYLVIFDWSTEDNLGIETNLYSTREKAMEKFDEYIEEESDAELSWVGSEVFDENGEVNDGYSLRTNEDTDADVELFWEVTDDTNAYKYSIIRLRKMEIQ